MNILTIIVLLILLFFILNGYRRGFIKTFVSLVSVVVAIVLVSIATPYVTQFLKTQTPVYSMIQEKCKDTFGLDAILKSDKQKDKEKDTKSETEKVKKKDQSDKKDDSLDKLANSITSSGEDAISMLNQAEFIENLKLPKVLQDMLEKNNNKNGYEKLEVQSFEDYIPNYMATLILNIISFIVTLILVISFLWITVMTLDVIANLPVLHGINRILGLLIGLFQGLVFVWIAFLIITVISNMQIGRQLMGAINESPILSFLYNKNIFLKMLTDAMSYFA